MEYYISKRTLHKDEDVNCQVTNAYLEIEITYDLDNSFFIYIVPRGSHSAFVLTCLDDMFDNMLNDLNEDSIEIIVKTWPTLANLLLNGINDKYSKGALIRLEDEDDGENKWFVSTVAGNISFDDIDELFTPRMMESIHLVNTLTIQLLTELTENKPSQLGAIKSGVIKGIKKGAAIAGIALLASVTGIDLSELI